MLGTVVIMCILCADVDRAIAVVHARMKWMVAPTTSLNKFSPTFKVRRRVYCIIIQSSFLLGVWLSLDFVL